LKIRSKEDRIVAQAIGSATSIPESAARPDVSNPSYKPFQLLHVGFVVAPIVAWLDRFSSDSQ
jgi:hypothetical protein